MPKFITKITNKVFQWPANPWYKSRIIYLPYIFFIALTVSTGLLAGGIRPFGAGCIGFQVGILWMTFQKRMQDKFDENWKDLERSMMRYEVRAEVEAEVRKEYEAGWRSS